MNKSLYEILEVEESASAAEIRSSYIRLAREYHPDTLSEEFLQRRVGRDAIRKFQSIQQAYEVLSDGERRKQYDRERNREPTPFHPTRRTSGGQGGKQRKRPGKGPHAVLVSRSPLRRRELFLCVFLILLGLSIAGKHFQTSRMEKERQTAEIARQVQERERKKEEQRLLAERRAQMFSLSREQSQFRSTALLEPGESSPKISRPEYVQWWGYEVVSSCTTITLNEFFLLDHCAGQSSTLRDVAGDTKWESLKFKAHSQPVAIKLWADFGTKRINLTPDSPSLNVIVKPGESLAVKARGFSGWRSKRAQDLSWTIQEEGCGHFNAGLLTSKFCSGATYRYSREFGMSAPENLKIRAYETEVRIALTAHF